MIRHFMCDVKFFIARYFSKSLVAITLYVWYYCFRRKKERESVFPCGIFLFLSFSIRWHKFYRHNLKEDIFLPTHHTYCVGWVFGGANMLIEIFTIFKITVLCLINFIPYGLVAIFPTLIFTRFATDSWNS